MAGVTRLLSQSKLEQSQEDTAAHLATVALSRKSSAASRRPHVIFDTSAGLSHRIGIIFQIPPPGQLGEAP